MMDMKNKRINLLIAVLALLTAITAIIYLTTREPETPGEIRINGESVRIADIEMSPVSGEVTNGKGEKKLIDAQGTGMSELCGTYTEATVTASDEYSAVVHSGEEAYLILSEDGSLRLVVFGDENAKRDVKNVSRIDFR